MPKRKNVFFDPKFNEWLFHQLVHVTAEQKAMLNTFELRWLRNKSSIKAFVANENLEKKLTFISKLGIEYSLAFFENKNDIAVEIKKTYRQYTMAGKTLENIEALMSKKVFVINSRDIALSLSMMSLNVHSEAYLLNPGFLSIKKTSRAIKNANISTRDLWALSNANIIHKETAREARNLARLMKEISRLSPYVESFGLQMLDMNILWLLYETPHNYVSLEYIQRELGASYKPSSVGARAAFLFREKRMLDKRPSSERVPSYILVAEGAHIVGLVNNYIIDKIYK